MLVDLVTRILTYSPIRRLTPAEALYHEYFDELRDENRYQEMLFKVKNIPDLFDFSQGTNDWMQRKLTSFVR